MRYSTALLPFVATATAIVIPDETTAQQLVLEAEQQVEKTVSSWREHVFPGANTLLTAAENILDTALEGLDRQTSKLRDAFINGLEELDIKSDITDFLSPSDYIDKDHHGHRAHATNLTVYQSIKASNYTSKFAKLVDDFPDLVDKLNSTSANVTVFVPTNHAFEKIPHHGKDHKPPKEFVEKVLKYHVLPGFYPAGRVLAHHTLPTALEEAELGDRPQRLRVSLGLFGVRLNFYSKVVYANLITKNGAIHGVDSILVPPPPVEKLISLFPSKFSTLELAASKTGFKHHHHKSDDEKLTGLTVFAPTNEAFRKLGPRANAFLFNTDRGLHYLKALLAYHVVANETLYSDEYYGKKKDASYADFQTAEYKDEYEDEEEVEGFKGPKHYHLDLPTLLGDKHLAVDITRLFGLIKIKVNGHVDVAIQDGLAKDGVVQVVNSVIIPPHPHRHRGFWDEEVDGEIPVEELIERLKPFVEEEQEAEAEAEIGEL
ncbi:FAS1 domain-containing protein [Hypoxylon sp. FL0543]|nr:FAS1 domain-containing protein [Hypoxylon sp. FL0543]